MSYVLFDILIVFFIFDAILLQEHCTYYQRSVSFFFRNQCDQSRIIPPTFMFMFKLDPTIQPTIIPLSLFGRIKVQKGRVWKF